MADGPILGAGPTWREKWDWLNCHCCLCLWWKYKEAMVAPELGFVRIIFARWLVLLPSGWSKHRGEADWGVGENFHKSDGFLYSSVWWCSLGVYMLVCSPPYLWQWSGGDGGGSGGGGGGVVVWWCGGVVCPRRSLQDGTKGARQSLAICCIILRQAWKGAIAEAGKNQPTWLAKGTKKRNGWQKFVEDSIFREVKTSPAQTNRYRPQ